MFVTCEDVLQWTCIVVYDIGFVAVIMRSDTYTQKREMTSFILIGFETSEKYRAYKKDLVRAMTGSKKCKCPFKLRAKPILGGNEWMVKLICVTHNHVLAKSFVGHPYVCRLSEDEKNIISDMTKSMIKPKNILLTLKEHNANNCTTTKQVCYN